MRRVIRSHPFFIILMSCFVNKVWVKKNDRIVILILKIQINVKLIKNNSVSIDNRYHFKHNRINKKVRFWEDSLWMTL